jgi:hypothetical protein
VISAADDSAVAATNCRRESFFHDMAFSLVSHRTKLQKSRCCFFCLSPFFSGSEISLFTIRAELQASVEKLGGTAL